MAQIIKLPAVDEARKKAAKPEPIPYQWTCWRCKHDTKIPTSEIMQTRIAPKIKGVKIVGGTKRWVCVPCKMRGITTEVF